MAETALYAAYRGIRTALTANAEMWGQGVYPDSGPAGATRPYVVFSFAAGGELNARKSQDAGFVLDVLCIASDMDTAMIGAGRIEELLNDKGEQEATSGAVDGGAVWYIQTITLENAVHFIEAVQGATQIYYSGGRYRLRMEKL